MAGDLLWDSVALALHMDDVGLTDVKGRAMTLNGGVTRSATWSKFGGYSAYFDGTDDEMYNTAPMPEIGSGNFSFQIFCHPVAQLQANPVVASIQDLLIEYKPTGYPNGFVINSAGVRTACGEFPENADYYLWVVKSAVSRTLYINEIFIATIPGGDDAYPESVIIGSNFIGSNPDTAFTGYLDDARLTTGVLREDYSIPVAAFPDSLPDPEGVVVGSFGFTGVAEGTAGPIGDVVGGLGFSGASVGIVAPMGDVAGGLRFVGAIVGEVPASGRIVGGLRFAGSAAGVVGRTGVVAGSFGFTGAVVGGVGRFGSVVGALRFAGSASGSHGVSGSVAGALQFVGAVTGTTPVVPVGQVAGVLRFAGHAIGLGAPIEEDTCA